MYLELENKRLGYEVEKVEREVLNERKARKREVNEVREMWEREVKEERQRGER